MVPVRQRGFSEKSMKFDVLRKSVGRSVDAAIVLPGVSRFCPLVLFIPSFV
jgi:hypothetical protein